MTVPVLRPALPRDCAAIDALLRGAGLRSEGEQLPTAVFVVAQAGTSIVGAIALEARGDAGLLRSLAVDPGWRGSGIGDRLVAHLLAIAAQQHLAKLWLLTTTAAAFFARWGFAVARRDEAPVAIATHPQFAAECPASATCMARSLAGAVRAYPSGSLPLRPDVAGATYLAVATDHCELTWYEVEPGVRFPRHDHEVDQITLVLDGELVFEVDGRPPIRLGSGEVVAVPAGVPHAVVAGATCVRAVDAWSRSPQSARDLAPTRADAAVDMAVHHALVRGLIDAGRVPPNRDLAARLGIAVPELERALRRLARSHSLVLYPHAPEPWLVHPFSTSPTHTWIARGDDGWWAPCLWCGLGVAT
ncbi:MAG TPA: arsenic resistance N-acetyltransferase ArsN2, partial [Planctomycetota bacterium]|nr:arsenic resistance N-acetyltransferase ArsN2 [Planctomycetota bacterium]